MPSKRIEEDFDKAMMNIYLTAKAEEGYNATIFFRMLCDHGGLETARRLIHNRKVSDGYAALWDLGRLDLTVEALIFDSPKWHQLFTQDELMAVQKRLKDYGYIRV